MSDDGDDREVPKPRPQLELIASPEPEPLPAPSLLDALLGRVLVEGGVVVERLGPDDERPDNVVDLAAERQRRRGQGPREVNLAEVLRRRLERFVRERQLGDADGPVIVDKSFLDAHGKELLPALVSGVAEAIVGAPLPSPPLADSASEHEDERCQDCESCDEPDGAPSRGLADELGALPDGALGPPEPVPEAERSAVELSIRVDVGSVVAGLVEGLLRRLVAPRPPTANPGEPPEHGG